MDSQDEQRKFIADAAARGLTMVELLTEFRGNDALQDRVNREMYPELYAMRPSAPVVPGSLCPAMGAAYRGMAQLSRYYGYNEQLYHDEWTQAESTPELQAERAQTCVRWFRAQVLSLTEKDTTQPPASDVAQACKPLFEALSEGYSPGRVVEAVFESTLAIANAYATECARTGKQSTFNLMVIGCLDHLQQSLFRLPKPVVLPPPPVDVTDPVSGEPIQDTELLEMLTKAGQLAGVEHE